MGPWTWAATYLNGSMTGIVRDYYASSPENSPTGPVTGTFRVEHGGSWFYAKWSLRAACRDFGNVEDEGSGLGFRCAARSRVGLTRRAVNERPNPHLKRRVFCVKATHPRMMSAYSAGLQPSLCGAGATSGGVMPFLSR